MKNNNNTIEIDVSCVIINYNTAEYTIDCINSLLKYTSSKVNIEYIIIDNASRINEYEKLNLFITKKANKNIKLYRSKVNNGFGSGNMYGYQFVKPSRYLLFLNNDTLLFDNNIIKKLVEFMDKHSKIGIVSPQQVNENNKKIYSFGHNNTITKVIFGDSFIEQFFNKNKVYRKREYTHPIKVDFACGSFMLVRTEYFKKINGFDTNLFLYYEENDLSLKMERLLKKDTYFYPNLLYKHYQNKSTQKNIYIKIEQKISLLYFVEKHCGYLKSKILNFYLILIYSLKCIIKPKYFKILKILLIGAPLSCSLKLKQTM